MMPRLSYATFALLIATSAVAAGQEVLGRQAVKPIGPPPVAGMTHEEAMVRTAYAKFAYACEQEVIGQLALEASGSPAAAPAGASGPSSGQRLAAAEVTFRLADFAVGNLNDIASRKAADLISPPIGEMLTATTPVHTYVDYGGGRSWYSVQPRWQPASAPSVEVLDATVSELHGMEWRGQAPTTLWQRFASYSVIVTFQGKSRGPYKALFVFGHDANGNEMIMPEDATTDSVALATALAVRLFPEPFVSTRLRTYPVVANWLNAKQRSGASCSTGQDDVCCDLIQLQCGPGKADVSEGMSRPLPGPPPGQ